MAEERHGWRSRLPQRRWIAVAAVLCFVAAELMSGHIAQRVGENPAFLPAILAVVACANALTAMVLFLNFLSGGRGRGKLVIIAGAYLFAALMTIPHALAFPGLITRVGPLAYSPSIATWFWVAWHMGFPVMLALAFMTGRWSDAWTVTARRRSIAVAGGVIGTVAIAGVVTAGILLGYPHLPQLINNGHMAKTSLRSTVTLVGINFIALIVAIRGTRKSEGMIAWVPVAAAGSFADVTLTIAAGSRYTVGWYTGRALSFLTANVILAALLFELFRVYRQSEQSRRILEDEALDLLRENRAAHYREDRVRRVIENAADAYVEISREGNIQAWNSKAREFFGWTASSVEGLPLVESVMAEQGWAEFRELIEEFWESEERFDGGYAELLVRSQDGREFPAEATLWVDESDSEPHMSFFLRDITIRRETQERLKQALGEGRRALAHMQELDRVKTNFVSSISHELRSPLTNTLGYLELLADGDLGELSESQLHMVHVAQRNANRLYALIEDLLILSKVEEGAYSVRFRAVPMFDVLQEVHSSNLALAEERNVDLLLGDMQIEGVCPGDAKQLTRAISNVVNNAVKFSDAGSRVVVTASQYRDEVVVTVEDNGIGIPADEQPKLFERFFRTSISVEQQHQGAGLGLTISKAIVEHHGGSIQVQSELGRGTTVTVRLPALVAPPAIAS